MSNKEPSRYHTLEKYMTIGVAAQAGIFLLYLLAAGFGISWLKVMTVIGVALIAILGLVSLYMTGELFRLRSRWIAAAFCAFLICTLFSLLLRYPSPAPVPVKPNEPALFLPFFLM